MIGLIGLRSSSPSCWDWSSTSATGFGCADGADGEGLLGGALGAGALGVAPGWALLWPDVPLGDPGPRFTADDGVEPLALVAPDAGGADPPPPCRGRAPRELWAERTRAEATNRPSSSPTSAPTGASRLTISTGVGGTSGPLVSWPSELRASAPEPPIALPVDEVAVEVFKEVEPG